MVVLGEKCQISPLKSKLTGDEPFFWEKFGKFSPKKKTLDITGCDICSYSH
jgi:hypothetical protein